jgi:hypothetical protein
MESRLIGLGISFTTCVNLYRDGQEFTRGNAINYWNEPAQMVIAFPRPLSKSGVVFLASKTDSATNYFRVRPDLIRRALRWLIANNPLYKHIRISEENLRELEESFANQEIPTIPITDDEVNELRGHDNHVHIESQTTAPISIDHKAISTANEAGEASDADTPGTVDDGANFCGRDEVHCVTESRGADPSTASNLSDASESEEDLLENVTESFELEVDQGSKQSEMEHILSAVGVNASDHKIPTGELRRRQDTIDEYKTKQLMQCCFPTLFPDGSGGYYPVDESESRLHEYTLTDYCAHLMKWHDRRYVIHGNFKFFCMNLIQRRQIDGLVRRVGFTETRAEAMELAGCGRAENRSNNQGQSKNENEELNSAMKVLDSLKPYFRVVRGSGLYWSNAREDLMSMIGNRVLPTKWPTFFLTLSAADTIWPDFARACNPSLSLDDCRKLFFNERRKCLCENPDISARHFSRRFKALFDNILCGRAKPLGEIVDHFWRVDFQQRGSPHIHCL